MKLQEIGYIFSGYQFRNDLPDIPAGDCKYIQMRDVDSDNMINRETVNGVEFTTKNNLASKYLLQKGDILFKNRGARNSASVYELDWDYAIASHQFLVVRVNEPRLLPGYLAWYINSDVVQSYFKQQAAGTTTLLVQKKTLEELEIVIPAIEIQRNIISIQELLIRERQLVNKRMGLYERYIERVLSESIKSRRVS